MDHLRSRIRAWTVFFICGLFISGVVGFVPMWLCNRWVSKLEGAG